MAVTPEGKTKKMVNAVLDEFAEPTKQRNIYAHEPNNLAEFDLTNLYRFWPVPSGFGASTLDCVVIYYGTAIMIETKAPGKIPTPRQIYTIAQIQAARGLVFVIDGPEGCGTLRNALNLIRLSHANNR